MSRGRNIPGVEDMKKPPAAGRLHTHSGLVIHLKTIRMLAHAKKEWTSSKGVQTRTPGSMSEEELGRMPTPSFMGCHMNGNRSDGSGSGIQA